MNNIERLKIQLQQFSIPESQRKGVFFKIGAGDYAEHDQFIGVPVPTLRQLAKEYCLLSLDELRVLLQSWVNEERLLALIILVNQYQKGNLLSRESIYDFYIEQIAYINNWNLVDASAHLIVGAYLHDKGKEPLLRLSQSSVMWERRIAMVATWYFIRQNEFEWTITIAESLLNDKHDLIHKAAGWMLREAGKRNQQVLIDFLEKHAIQMPRPMLRYAIEKLSFTERQDYLKRKIMN